jgi:hypothetical protein
MITGKAQKWWSLKKSISLDVPERSSINNYKQREEKCAELSPFLAKPRENP